MWGLFFSQLKQMLVRDGRSNRQDFLLGGVLPLWLALTGLMAAPTVPTLGELAGILFIATVFLSRAALAKAIRRAHDLGLPDELLKSSKRQIQAYSQAFLLFVMASIIQQADASNNALVALVSSAVMAAGSVVIFLGGSKIFNVLATHGSRRPLSFEDILAADPAAPHHPVMASHPTPAPRPQPAAAPRHAPQTSPRTAPAQQPQPASEPRAARPALKVSGAPRPPPAPQSAPMVRPVVRNRPRGAIGEWSPPGDKR